MWHLGRVSLCRRCLTESDGRRRCPAAVFRCFDTQPGEVQRKELHFRRVWIGLYDGFMILETTTVFVAEQIAMIRGYPKMTQDYLMMYIFYLYIDDFPIQSLS